MLAAGWNLPSWGFPQGHTGSFGGRNSQSATGLLFDALAEPWASPLMAMFSRNNQWQFLQPGRSTASQCCLATHRARTFRAALLPRTSQRRSKKRTGHFPSGHNRYMRAPIDPIYGTPVDQWRTDTSFRCASVAQLIWHAAAGNVAFEYEFAHTPVGREALGATHASDVSYVFGTLDQGIWGVGPPVPATAVDTPVSE